MTRWVAAAVLLVATILTIAPAHAVPPGPAATSAAAGEHWLTDNMTIPGAVCVYEDGTAGSPLLRIRVRPPVVFARNRRDGRIDHQRISWGYVIQQGSDGVKFETVARSRLQFAWASDHVPAALDWKSWRVTRQDYHQRVVVVVRWYRNGHVVATVRMVPVYYRYRPHMLVFRRGCTG